MTDRILTARHEAAHAVLAYSVGLLVAPMGLALGDATGFTPDGVAYVGAYHGGGPPPARNLAAVLMAGEVLEALDQGHTIADDRLADALAAARCAFVLLKDRAALLGDSRADLVRAFTALLDAQPRAGDAQLIAAFREVEAGTGEVLARPDVARSIAAVAAALLEGGRLDGHAVERLIEPSAMVIAPQFARNLFDLFEDGRPVFLAFSGGKESVVLADLCEPFRKRVALLWVNTGHMAPHMVEFVRGYRDRFRVIEVQSDDVLAVWRAAGIPADVVTAQHALGWREPRLQAWTDCCFANRQAPMNAFLAAQGPSILIHGQRRADRGPTAATLRARMAQSVDVAAPLWEWSTADVMDHIERRGLALPAHYGEFPDSLECLCCPATVTAERMRYLDAHHPEAAAFVRPLIRRSVSAALGVLEEIADVVGDEEAPSGCSPTDLINEPAA